MKNRYNFKDRVGEKHITNEGYNIEIIEYFGALNCTIQFDNGTILKNKRYDRIKNGQIKNPQHTSVFGVGCFGICKYNGITHPKSYQPWAGMLERCYDSKYQQKYPTYKDVTVCAEWHNFQNFTPWFEENYKKSFVLDKDVLFKNNKIYSPINCIFIPTEINGTFTKCNSKRGQYPIGVSKVGNKFKAQININKKIIRLGHFNTIEEAFFVYKTNKEKRIKELAEKYKNQITKLTYTTLINYKVEITD